MTAERKETKYGKRNESREKTESAGHGKHAETDAADAGYAAQDA